MEDEITKSIREFQNRKIHDSLDEKTIRAIPDDKLEQAVVDYVLLKIGNDFEQEFETVTSLPQPFQVIYSTFSYEAEINNGGFNQYFWNSTGQFAFVTLDALRILGANEHAALLEEAIEIFQREEPQQRRFYEEGTLEAFSESYKHTGLGEVDKKFFELEDLSRRRIEYIRANAIEFSTNSAPNSGTRPTTK